MCRDGRVAFVGPTDAAREQAGAQAREVDLSGLTIVPGFIDAHAHLRGIGERELLLDLTEAASIRDLQSRLAERISAARPGQWILGRGWIETFWSPAAFPTRHDLDAVSPKHPVYLIRADGHAVVVNSDALRRSGISRTTEAPPGGEILRHADTGEPTGILVDRAIDLAWRQIPESDRADHDNAIRLGLRRSVEAGWCQIHDAGGSLEDVHAVERAHADGGPLLSVYKAISAPGSQADELIGRGWGQAQDGQSVVVRSIKLLLDGALGSRGAALLEPYADADTTGLMIHEPVVLRPLLARALKSGIQVWIHAIGDRANRIALDLCEHAFADVPPPERPAADPRWRIEHAQILHPEDIPRFSQLGVIPSMQPSHAIGDLHFASSRLGTDRLAGAYAWQNLLDAGCIIPGGSDAPVEKGDPILEFYAAVCRRPLNGLGGPGWHPEQAVSRLDALRMLTRWPAHAAFQEHLRGDLTPGKLADFTVLSQDPMAVADDRILATRCVMTVIGGKILHDARS